MRAMRLLLLAFGSLLAVSAQGQDCFRTSVMTPTPLMGNNGEIFRTADGAIYEVVGSYEYLYAYYPNVTICLSRNKMFVEGKTVGISIVKAAQRPSPPVSASDKPGRQRTSRSSVAPVTVVFRIRGCDYFIADGPRGLYLLEWYGGYDPDRGDGILGELDGYGFKDVIYENGSDGRLYVDDYMLSKDRALEKLSNKCN